MATNLAKVLSSYADDYVESYFDAWKDAEAHRLGENHAAIIFQKAWRHYVNRTNTFYRTIKAIIIQRYFRGYRARKEFEQALRDKYETRYMKIFDKKAILIQKTWRGYYSRRYKFNLKDRKKYVSGLASKYSTIRKTLQDYEQKQKELDKQQSDLERKLVYEKFSEKYHHLLGTSRIPGVLAKVDSSPDPRKVSLRNLPESAIRSSFSVRSYIRESRKYFHNKYINIMKKGDSHAESEEAKEKYAKGPFLPRYRVEKLKNRQPKTTLRMDEEYDKIYLEREEQRVKKVMNISDKVFVISKNFESSYRPSVYQGNPYSKMDYGRSTFRDPNVLYLKPIAKQDFKTVLPPIPFFEDARKD